MKIQPVSAYFQKKAVFIKKEKRGNLIIKFVRTGLNPMKTDAKHESEGHDT